MKAMMKISVGCERFHFISFYVQQVFFVQNMILFLLHKSSDDNVHQGEELHLTFLEFITFLAVQVPLNKN